MLTLIKSSFAPNLCRNIRNAKISSLFKLLGFNLKEYQAKNCGEFWERYGDNIDYIYFDAKKFYLDRARKLHPDINRDKSVTELNEIWQRIEEILRKRGYTNKPIYYSISNKYNRYKELEKERFERYKKNKKCIKKYT